MPYTWESVHEEFVSVPFYEKGVSKLEEARLLKVLANLAVTPAQRVFILLKVVEARLDSSPNYLRPIPFFVWKDCVTEILVILDLLLQHSNIRVGRTSKSLDIKETKKGDDYLGMIHVWGDLAGLVERLSFEFFCTLKFMNPILQEYRETLEHEINFIVVCQNVISYYERKRCCGKSKIVSGGSARVATVFLGIVYYKPKWIYEEMCNGVEAHDPNCVPRRARLPDKSITLVNQLADLIFKYGDRECKMYARLNIAYYYAISDMLSESKYLLLEVCAYESDMQFGDLLQLNRATAQYALCAFRNGYPREARSSLSGLRAKGFTKELGQGAVIYTSERVEQEDMENSSHKSIEQEDLESARFPPHMHIDVELLEAVYIMCGMLLEEVPGSEKDASIELVRQSAVLIKQKCNVKHEDTRKFLDDMSR